MVGNQLLQALYSMAEEKDSEEDVLALINALALIFISLPVSCTICFVLCKLHNPSNYINRTATRLFSMTVCWQWWRT